MLGGRAARAEEKMEEHMFEKIESIEIPEQKAEICKSIIESLPEWFGIPESNQEYCDGVKDKPFYCIKKNNEVIGFVSIKHNNKYTLEIYVMGIKKEFHNIGIGKKLIKEIVKHAKKEKYEYLEVKTLDESRESPEYKKTRMFYSSVGFLPVDVLLNEWGNDNPCLIMIMKIKNDEF